MGRASGAELIVSEHVDLLGGEVLAPHHRRGPVVLLEFLRWRAERWMKLRHLPAALLHSPGFAARHGMRMMAHTFRGSSLRSLLGLEDERKAFARYRAIRKAERAYVRGPVSSTTSHRSAV